MISGTTGRVKRLALRCIPPSRLLEAKFLWKRFRKTLDPELKIVDALLQEKRRFVDVGANAGIYSFYFARDFEAVESFEPLLPAVRPLRDAGLLNVRPHVVALSQESGLGRLAVPVLKTQQEFALASLESTSPNASMVPVELATLDSYSWQDIDLIKIDVEGHELKVLRGGEQTLTRCRPLIICEVEARHSPVPITETFSFLEKLGFIGFFVWGSKILPTAHLEPKTHQDVAKIGRRLGYANNFMFLPNESVDRALQLWSRGGLV